MVLLAHFIPESSRLHIPYMFYGVDLFFTISGFLITTILLKYRFEGNMNQSTILKNFYIRRVLRLFPIYYLFVLFFFLAKHFANLYMWKDGYNFYFFTYFQNLYFFKQGSFNSMFSHLWSLGVEEQFYMIWPFLILFLPRKALPYLLVIIISFSIAVNSICASVPMIRSLTFSNFHTLGIGALFAYFHVLKPDNTGFSKIIQHRTVLASILLIIMIFVLINSNHLGSFAPLIIETTLSLTTAAFVISSTYGWQGIISYLTRTKGLMYIGKISYGIYLYHLPLPAFTRIIYQKVTGSELLIHSTAINFLFYTTLTIVLAHLSFKFVERPILAFKSRFE